MRLNLFLEDDNEADNSWEFLCCLIMVDLHATYSYKIESLWYVNLFSIIRQATRYKSQVVGKASTLSEDLYICIILFQ